MAACGILLSQSFMLFCMATQSKDKVGKSQSPCASVEAFGTGMEVCGVIQKRTVQEMVSKTWKKEDELKQLKSELAALDRKIQLELAPKQEEPPGQGQEQGGSQAIPKVENVPKPDDTARDYIRDRIIIGTPGISEHKEPRGMKI